MRLITVEPTSDQMGVWAIVCDAETSSGNTGLAEEEEGDGFAKLDWELDIGSPAWADG